MLANPQQVAVQTLPAFALPSEGGQFSTIQLDGRHTRIYTRTLQSRGRPPSTLVVGADLEPEDLEPSSICCSCS